VGKQKFKVAELPLEQVRKCKFELHQLTEKGQIVGRVYRRQPLFETMQARGELTREEAQALRYYRERHELCHRSLTRSCLSPTVGGRSNNFGGHSPFSTRAGQELQMMEDAAGLFVGALRAVAIEDLSFNKIAMARYGSKQETVGGRERILPKSKNHARKVRAEFYAALKLLLPTAQSFYVLNFPVDFMAHMAQKSINGGNAPKQDAVTHIAPRHHQKVACS
jgi:hypothetical protein